jgi:hypothetical protein
MRHAVRALLAATLAVALVACQGAVDDDTAQRAQQRLQSNVSSVQQTTVTLMTQIDAVPDVQFSRGIAGAVGNTYNSFNSVARNIEVPDDAVSEYRAMMSASGAVQTYATRAGKSQSQGEYTLNIAAVKQKVAEFDLAAAGLLAKLDQIAND